MTDTTAPQPLIAHCYPSPADATNWTDTVEIRTGDTVLIDDFEVREHPEVPLNTTQLDTVLQRLGYARTGEWVRTPDERAEAPVEPLR